MRSFCLGLVVHLLLVASSYSSEVKNEKDEKMLIMLEIEPIKSDDRSKRSSTGEAVRKERQSPDVPQDYLSLLQQLSQQQQQQPQQQAAASAQQPQQQLIQQLVVSRDGSRQPTAARYVLTQDGRLLDGNSLAGFGQPQTFPQFPQGFGQFGFPPQQLPQGFIQAQQLPPGLLQQQQLPQGLIQPQQLPQQQQQSQQQQQQLVQAQALGIQSIQQDPLQSTQPAQIPPAPTQTVRPGQRPQISEFARQQQRILQEVRDAPLRAQIAGLTIRPPNNPVQPVPTGPNSQSPQVFAPTGQQQQQQQAQFGLQQFQDPQNPNVVYTPVPVDPQTYQLQLQQQLAAQFGVGDDPRFFAQPQRPGAVSQQLVYQPQIPQDFSQDKIRRPITVLPSPSQPQVAQQNPPQQYLIETTRPSTPQPPQFLPADAAAQVQYVQQPVQQPAQQPAPQPVPQPVPQPASQPAQQPAQQPASSRQEAGQQSTLLQPVAGRGLFTPVKPSRSSIFVSRSSAPKSVSLTITDDLAGDVTTGSVTSEKVPVVRLPSPTGQRPLSKQELDALVDAGYTVTPVQDPQQLQYLKAKRQPVVQERRNHVVYENPQDGVLYQYSPGSSDPTSVIKTKKSAPNSQYFSTS